MPSIRRKPAASPTPPETLVRRTGYGLALTTLLLTVALLAGVGLATAAVAIRSTDASVDRSLRAAATAAIAYLELVDAEASPTPAPSAGQTPWSSGEVEPSDGVDATDSAEPTDEGEASDEPDEQESSDPPATHRPRSSGAPESTDPPGATGEPEPSDDISTEPPDGVIAPAPIVGGPIFLALAPLAEPMAEPTPSAAGEFETEPDDQPPAASDTFFLVLDAQGKLLSNPRRVLLAGLPDAAAVTAAAANGEDWRTVYADGAPVRLFTQRVTDGQGGPPAYLQSGMVLSLHQVQRNEILMTIVLASLLGLLGAGVVTLLVTRRALTPVRNAFSAERRFVAAASHELRTPVAVLHALAEVLQREELVKPEGRQMVDDIILETDRLGQLVGDLLALSSVEAGAVVVEPARIEARTFVADLARRVESVAAQRGLSVVVEQDGMTAAPELTLLTDPNRLAQLLLIFVDNAIEHSPPGGELRLIVGPLTEHGHDYVSMAVVDQGPGVPLAERERIFEPFARLEARGRTSDGTGLGLAIARSLADRLGVTLRVGDAAGGGAVFSVTLSRSTSNVAEAGRLPSGPTARERPISGS